jgi:hypothetical protein
MHVNGLARLLLMSTSFPLLIRVDYLDNAIISQSLEAQYSF